MIYLDENAILVSHGFPWLQNTLRDPFDGSIHWLPPWPGAASAPAKHGHGRLRSACLEQVMP
jgi:hypothetical protein